ncbi:MAG: hypothetical protein HQL31_02270 [Planctomycetes bacterium]|nr:hypothetical protein [Planctomycetota bacterium]
MIGRRLLAYTRRFRFFPFLLLLVLAFEVQGKIGELEGTDPFKGGLIFLNLDSLRLSFQTGRLKRAIKPGEAHAMANALLELDPSKPLADETFFAPFFQGDLSSPLKALIAEARRELELLPTEERISRTAQLYRELSDNLRSIATERKVLTFRASLTETRDSNITQTPDGEPSVSNRRGSFNDSKASLSSESRDLGAMGILAADFSLGQTHHWGSGFSNRNSQNAALTITNRRETKTRYLMTTNYSLGLRSDFLYTTGTREQSFLTWTPGTLLVFNPVQKKKSLFQVFVPVVQAGFEIRDYTGSDKIDALGQSKDTLTPNVTAILMALGRYKEADHRAMMLLNLRSSSSDSPDLENLSLRWGLSWTSQFHGWTMTPDLAYAQRDQNNYQGQARTDRAFEIGWVCKKEFQKGRLELNSLLRYTEQHSNIPTFVYENTRFSMGVSCKL